MFEKKFCVSVERDIMVPMRDGVKLSTDIYRPDSPETFPAILVRTPYNKSARLPPIATMFAEHGYISVLQDMRGWYASEGKKDEKDETEDGYDTVEWVASLPYCTGKVGMWGYSYPLVAALAAAHAQPPHLCCLLGGGIPSLSEEDPVIGATGNPTDILETGRRFLWVRGMGKSDPQRGKGDWNWEPTTREESSRLRARTTDLRIIRLNDVRHLLP